MVKPSRQLQQLQTMLLAFVIALLLGSHAEALHITVAGHTVDLGNPLGHQQGGHSAPHTGSNANLASALCPVASIGNVQLTPFPMRTDDVCGSFGLNVANNAYACVAFGQMGSLLGNPPLRCAPDAVPVHPDTDPQGVPIPQPLPDRRQNGQLPQTLPASQVLRTEGATYSWLHSQVQRVYLYASCAEQGNHAAWQPPQGWQLQKMVHIANGHPAALDKMHSQHLQKTSLPFMAIIKQEAASRTASKTGCQAWAKRAASGATNASAELCDGGVLVFVIRGTATPFEWTLDYTYKTRPDPNYGPGHFHEGFLAVANQLWDNGMKEALDAAVAAGDVRHIIITGHSLGGASTTLLSARAQAYLDQAVAARAHSSAAVQAPSLTAVMFGGPNVGDAAFAAHFNKVVNARNVQYKYDIIYQVPCAPQIAGCHKQLVAVPTTEGSHVTGSWSYARVGGEVTLDLQNIPVQREAWSRMTVFTQQDFCRTQETVLWNVDASHYCSYFCSLGAYAGMGGSWCKLWPEAAGSEADGGASYCFQGVQGAAYPKTPSFPFKDRQG